jgi:MATE family multidrug resistance protein
MEVIEKLKIKLQDFVVSSSEASSTSQEVSKNLMRSLINDDSGAESDVPYTQSNHRDAEDELFGLHESSPFMDRVKVLFMQSFPVVISFFLSIGGTFINLIFAGQYVHETGDKSAVFAGVSLANMFANVSCLSILIGMSSAVETLGSQHNGAGNYREVGIILQRSYLILGIITIPIAVLWFFTADIFAALGVEPVVCAVIQRFIRIRCLTIPVDVINESYEKYLMSIGVMRPSMWANISFNVFILLFDTIFVYGLRLHYDCLAWSWVLSLYLSAIIQVALSWNHPSVQRTLQPFDKAAWEDWYEFIMLGLPGTVMLCSEWWAYEVLTIFASLLGTAEVAAQTIILQTASLAFMIPLGIGVACASLVGNALGAGKKSLAIDLGKLSISGIFCLELLIGLTMLIGGPYFVDMFTNDPQVILVANRAVPFLSLFTMIDGLQGVCSGVLRGAGKQGIGAVANIFAFYVIGLPMAWVLCFQAGFGVNGLMMGIAFGTVFQVIVLVTIIFAFENYLYSSNIHAATLDTHASSDRKSSKPHHRDFQRLQDHDDEESRHGIALNPVVRNRSASKVDS